MKTDIGVIVGRFQVDNLHKAHHDLIQEVMKNHDKVIVFLGVAPAKSTRRNPLDFKSREFMVRASYPDLTILPLYDQNSDDLWSQELDQRIREVFPIGTVTLYGSRDGFIPHYKGQFPTIKLDAVHKISGSEIRKTLSNQIKATAEFRHGVIYGTYDRFPISYTCVDVAIINYDKNEILLGRKKADPQYQYRFIGGFVDINKDGSLEVAATREAIEETGGIDIGKPTYIGSLKVNDWRYRNEQDGIMTALFKVPFIFGAPRASDDIDELKWFPLDKEISVVENHKALLELLRADLNRQLNKKEE